MAVAEALLGSPLALLQFHRLCALESMLASSMLTVQLALFGFSSDEENKWLWVTTVMIPILMTAKRLPMIGRQVSRCRRIEQAFRYRSVVEDLEQMFLSDTGRLLRSLGIALMMWYFLCVILIVIVPPCG